MSQDFNSSMQQGNVTAPPQNLPYPNVGPTSNGHVSSGSTLLQVYSARSVSTQDIHDLFSVFGTVSVQNMSTRQGFSGIFADVHFNSEQLTRDALAVIRGGTLAGISLASAVENNASVMNSNGQTAANATSPAAGCASKKVSPLQFTVLNNAGVQSHVNDGLVKRFKIKSLGRFLDRVSSLWTARSSRSSKADAKQQLHSPEKISKTFSRTSIDGMQDSSSPESVATANWKHSLSSQQLMSSGTADISRAPQQQEQATVISPPLQSSTIVQKRHLSASSIETASNLGTVPHRVSSATSITEITSSLSQSSSASSLDTVAVIAASLPQGQQQATTVSPPQPPATIGQKQNPSTSSSEAPEKVAPICHGESVLLTTQAFSSQSAPLLIPLLSGLLPPPQASSAILNVASSAVFPLKPPQSTGQGTAPGPAIQSLQPRRAVISCGQQWAAVPVAAGQSLPPPIPPFLAFPPFSAFRPIPPFIGFPPPNLTSDAVVRAWPMNLYYQQQRVCADYVPVHWISSVDKIGHRVIALSTESTEYKDVHATLQRSNTTARKVIQIQRIENPTLFRHYLIQKEKVTWSCPSGHLVERNLFHGTSKEHLDGICAEGFDRSRAGHSVGAWQGNGSYFSTSFDYSSRRNYAREGHVLYCKVLVGESVLGRQGLTHLPCKPRFPGIKYDSAVDDLQNPSIFVIFADYNAYPAYLITLAT